MDTAKELTLTRILDAPREVVFGLWIKPEHVKQWWGPTGFTNPVCRLDAKPGGSIYIDMKGPDGTVYPMSGTFKEIIIPQKIVFTSNALDSSGKPLFEVNNTITFEDVKGQTKLTVNARVSEITKEAKPYLDGMNEGWNQTLDRLMSYAAKQPANTISHH